MPSTSELVAPTRAEFATADPGEAHAHIAESYFDNRLRVVGRREDFRFGQTRHDLGPVRLDVLHAAPTIELDCAPTGCVLVARVLDGTIVVDGNGRRRSFGRGDIFLVAQPDQPFTACVESATVEIVGIDSGLLARVLGERISPLQAVRRFRGEPLPPALAMYWRRTVDYVLGAVLANPVAVASPLVVNAGNALLATALLAAFENGRMGAAHANGAVDTHPDTLRRAMDYIEANPDLSLTVSDIARAAYVTPRAVQLSFRRHLDTTPMAYLRRVRLARVHDDLLAAAPTTSTVTGIAARWGFASSRFTAAYRAAFDELPSHTLDR